MSSFSPFSSWTKIEEIICIEISSIKTEVEQLKVEIQWSLIQLRLLFGLNISVDMTKVKKSTWLNRSSNQKPTFKKELVLKLANLN